MNKILIIFLVFFASFSCFSQDDTEEDTNSVAFYEEAALRKEKDYLTFKESFLEALKQKGIENYNKALESLAVCEEVYPNNIAMLFELAKNNYNLKQYEEAHHYCEKALEMEPSHFWLLALSRDVYEKEQNYEEALRIQKILYSQKKSEAGRLLKYYYLLKDKEEGKKLLSEIDQKAIYVTSISFYKRYFNAESSFVENKNTKKTIAKNTGLVQLQKDFTKNKDFKILQEILKKENLSKQFQKLLEDSSLGIDLFPAQAQVYLYNAYALNGLSKYRKAIESLETGLDYVVDDSEMSLAFYAALIKNYQSMNNSKKASYYKKLVQNLKDIK